MFATDFVTTGAIPISSSSSISFFISCLSKASKFFTNFPRLFSLAKATKIAAMCGRSSRRQSSMRFPKSRKVEIGHFCRRMKALTSLTSCSYDRIFVACKNGSFMTHSHANFKLLKCNSFDLVERISTRIDKCETCVKFKS